MNARPFWILAGLGLWLPLVLSFVSGLNLNHVAGVPAAQLSMVLLLVMATLLLGLLIGRSVASEPVR
ncbi:MAG: hypothetical protein JOZ39_07150 [Chloroflexi bacterium]|nr:hypothetical protein [Chloroflexota bacterium]